MEAYLCRTPRLAPVAVTRERPTSPGPRTDDPQPEGRVAGWKVGGLLLLVLGVGLTVAGSATALQEIAFHLECPPGSSTVQPASPPGVWDCTARFEYLSASTGLTDPTQPAIVGLEVVDAEPWLQPVLSNSEIVSTGPAAGEETVTKPVRVSVSTTMQAPAFQTTSLVIEPYVIQHPRSEGELSRITELSGSSVTVTPGYRSNFDARIEPTEANARPQGVLEYEITIDNYSNGMTRFTFSPPEEPPEGFQVMAPEPVTVPGMTGGVVGNASEEGPTTFTVPFEVQAPYSNGYVNERVPIGLTVQAGYALEESLDPKSARLEATAQVQGAYAPGPSVLAAALAVGGAAAVARRRA